MMGFVRPVSGIVFCRGERLIYESRHLATWRGLISLVSQDSLVFKRSLRENLCYGAGETGDGELVKALQMTSLDEWVDSLPDGLETVLHGREKQLSGGQRQRLQLCRMLIRNKPILFMVRCLVWFV